MTIRKSRRLKPINFSVIFAPAAALMMHLNFARKALLLGFIALLSFSVISSSLYLRLADDIKTAKQEITGLTYIPPLFKAVQLFQQHRGLSAGVLGGTLELKEKRLSKLVQSISAFNLLEKTLPDTITSGITWQKIRNEWDQLSDNGIKLSQQDNFTQHTELINQMLFLGQFIADKYKLTNHPDLDAYYLINTALYQLTTTQENLGRIRAYSMGLLAKKNSTEDQRIQIKILRAQAETAIQNLEINFKKTRRVNSTLQPLLSSLSKDISEHSQHIFKLMESDIILGLYSISPTNFFDITTAAIDSTYSSLFQSLLPTINQLINNHLTHVERTLLICKITIVVSFLVLFYFAIGLYIATQRNIEFISHTTLNFFKGDFSNRLHFNSNSEFKSLADSFNSMADNLAQLIKREKEDKARIHAIINSAPDGMIQMNAEGVVIGWSHQAESIFGWKDEEIIGQALHEKIIPLRFWTAYTEGLRRFITTGYNPVLNKTVEIEGLHREGHEFPIELIIAPIKMKGRYEFNAFIRDISQRKQSEEKLQLLARVFNDIREGIMITDIKGVITDVNPAFYEITGYSRKEVLGKNSNLLNSDKHPPEFYSAIGQALIKQGYWRGEVWSRKKDGELFAESLTISSILGDDEKPLNYVGVFSDITQSKKQQQTLELMAHYDVLTQLPNRILLADRFNQAIGHSKRTNSLLATCFLDLDNFKPVNDTYGHDAGDKLLIEIAARIKSIIREEDTVSRLGGDEFVILLGDIKKNKQCKHLLDRLLGMISQPYLIDGHAVYITASIGYSLYPQDNADLDTLIRHADQAMYQAKLIGRNTYHQFNAEEDRQLIKKNHRLHEIKDALKNQQFCLYYQPKINMRTGAVYGAEALIRWIHPQQGVILPAEFLPIIENTELEVKIGNWVINEVLNQLDLWREQGIRLQLSVNISSGHLLSSSFSADLDTVLAKYPDINSRYFQLEILESSALGDLNTISKIIKTCREALGVQIALDDFGTGYSSLTHLRNLHTNTIKIDQSFVRNILSDPNDYAIGESVIGLADSFSRQVIAEGVETNEDGLMLLLMNCELAQGYGIARPMPANELPEWLNNYQPNKAWLSIGNKIFTPTEKKLAIFKLTFKRWFDKFENNIKKSPDETKHWPIIEEKKCHCRAWIKREQQGQLFEAQWLEKLEQSTNEIHHIANNLLIKYQSEKIDEARNGLIELQTVFKQVNDFLE